MDTKRIIAGFIDIIIAGIIQVILFSIFFLRPLIIENGFDENMFNPWVRCLIITYCSWSFMILRDIFGKKSIGKIIMKMKIVNKADGKESSVIKRFLRNITWLFGPLDILVFLFTKERIGDKIVGTNVIKI
jgi:uncharacterized RDD family membrane protein YckC